MNTQPEQASDTEIAESAIEESQGVVMEGKTKARIVPAGPYLRSKKNNIAMNMPEPEGKLGLRIFVWCMELKDKKLEYLGERECQKLSYSLTVD